MIKITIFKGNVNEIDVTDLKREEEQIEQQPVKINYVEQREIALTKLHKKEIIRDYKKKFPQYFTNFPIDDIDGMTISQLSELEERMEFIVGTRCTNFVKSSVDLIAFSAEFLSGLKNYRTDLYNHPNTQFAIDRLSLEYDHKYYISPIEHMMLHLMQVASITISKNNVMNETQKSSNEKIDDEIID